MITTIPTPSAKISTVDALWTLIQGQTKAVRKALTDRLIAEREQSKTEKQQAMVRESLTRAINELHMAQRGEIKLKDAKDLFK